MTHDIAAYVEIRQPPRGCPCFRARDELASDAETAVRSIHDEPHDFGVSAHLEQLSLRCVQPSDDLPGRQHGDEHDILGGIDHSREALGHRDRR